MINSLLLGLIGSFWNVSGVVPFLEKDISLEPGINVLQTETPWNAVTLLDKDQKKLPPLEYRGKGGEFFSWPSPDKDEKNPEENQEGLTKLLTFDTPRIIIEVYSPEAITLTAQFFNTQDPEQNLVAQAGITDFDTGINFDDFTFGESLLDGVEITQFANETILGDFSQSGLHPQFITREGWGADESLREWSLTRGISNYFRSAPAEAQKYMLKSQWPLITQKLSENGKKLTWPIEESQEIQKIVVHHTGEYIDNTQQMRRTPREHMRAIYQYHTLTKKWGDIGYNFVIDKLGNIYEGRAGGPKAVGAHTAFYNTGTVGIALMGNFNVEEPTDAQLKVLSILLSYLSEKYEIDPQSRSEFLGLDTPNIAGHRDVARQGYGTACPGTNLIKRMNSIRNTVETILEELEHQRDGLPKGLDFLGKSKAAPKVQGRVPRFVMPDKKPLITGKILERNLMQRGERKTLSLTFTNNTLRTWPRYTSLVASDAPQGIEVEPFRTSDPIAPGESGTFKGVVTVHSTPNGFHHITLDPLFLKDSYFEEKDRPKFNIPLQISGTRELVTPQKTTIKSTYASSVPSSLFFRSGSPEPEVKIKLAFFEKDFAQINANTPLVIQHKNKKLEIVEPEKSVRILLKNPQTIQVSTENKSWDLDEVHLVTEGVLRVQNYNRGLSQTIPYNRFRRQINVHPQAHQKLLLVNQLPLEEYLQGLSEEPDTQPTEKKHAIHILARSYAYVYSGERRKFRTHLYDLEDDPRTSQMYLGFDWENLHSQQRDLLEETRGMVVTHKGQPVIAPYFTQSDGHSSDKWQKSYPWAKVQPLPLDKGLEPRGHGVGLSGHSAHQLAKQGKNFKEIIDYFFENVEIRKIY